LSFSKDYIKADTAEHVKMYNDATIIALAFTCMKFL